MLRITIPEMEFWDERKEEFRYTKEQTLQLEHSLVSLSKWESKFCKPFLSKQEKTLEEMTRISRPQAVCVRSTVICSLSMVILAFCSIGSPCVIWIEFAHTPPVGASAGGDGQGAARCGRTPHGAAQGERAGVYCPSLWLRSWCAFMW